MPVSSSLAASSAPRPAPRAAPVPAPGDAEGALDHGHAHSHPHDPPRAASVRIGPSVLRLSLAARLGLAIAFLTPLWIAVFLVVRSQP